MPAHTSAEHPTPPIRVWLDDARPMPHGWTHHVLTAHDAIALLTTGQVVAISLDHDLGDEAVVGTGYDVARWIEDHVAMHGFRPPPIITVHSANPVGRQRMEQAIRSIKRLTVQP